MPSRCPFAVRIYALIPSPSSTPASTPASAPSSLPPRPREPSDTGPRDWARQNVVGIPRPFHHKQPVSTVPQVRARVLGANLGSLRELTVSSQSTSAGCATTR
jgi:hypothetical protein